MPSPNGPGAARTFDYLIVDVFTETPFGGNQLAVLLDARGISAAGMQAIAREFNFAETAFVLPSRRADCQRRVRIFTPGEELPFAGHPTVGTACALVMAGACTAGEIRLDEEIGPVPVLVAATEIGLAGRLRLDQPPEIPDKPAPSAAAMAAMLSLPEAAVTNVFGAGMGVDFTFVQVRSPHEVDAARLDTHAWEKELSGQWGAQVYVFSGAPTDGGSIHARMFAPSFGVGEDPATGSAAAALVGAAALNSASGQVSLEIRQGVAMGRPSLISAQARLGPAEKCEIEVGGGCVLIARGQIDIPSASLEAES